MTTEFSGTVPFKIQAQEAQPGFMQKMLQKNLESGDFGDGSLRFQCRIAKDANELFKRVETDEGVFVLNPKGKAQFGRNSEGNPYLTVGLIEEATGKRLRLRWEGLAVPKKMLEVAIKHDMGKEVKAATVTLNMGDAVVLELGPIVPDNRQSRNKAKNGPKERRHDRWCEANMDQRMRKVAGE